MDAGLLVKVKSIFDGVFPIWRRPARSWNSSVESLCRKADGGMNRGGASAHRIDCCEYRQAAGANAEAVIRSVELIVQRRWQTFVPQTKTPASRRGLICQSAYKRINAGSVLRPGTCN